MEEREQHRLVLVKDERDGCAAKQSTEKIKEGRTILKRWYRIRENEEQDVERKRE